jgi:hypothetical protein
MISNDLRLKLPVASLISLDHSPFSHVNCCDVRQIYHALVEGAGKAGSEAIAKNQQTAEILAGEIFAGRAANLTVSKRVNGPGPIPIAFRRSSAEQSKRFPE